jgi:hypothetical protein
MIESIEKLLGLDFESIRSSDVLSGVQIPEPEFIDLDSYIELPNLGVSLVLTRGEFVSTIQLYSQGRDGYREFDGKVPGDIVFSMSRADVRGKLGDAKSSGEAVSVPILGDKPAWDKFDVGGIAVHVEYCSDLTSVGLVSISAKEA